MVRRAFIVGFGAIAALMIGASVAWACTAAPTMSLKRVDPALAGPNQPAAGASTSASGGFLASPSSSTVSVKMVTGAWNSGDVVQIHWNSLNGPVLATTAGPNFTVPVQVPKVAPGVYYIVAADPAGINKMAQAIEVTGPAGVIAPSPALLPRVAPSHAGGGDLVLGAGLLGGGMVALFSGVTVMTLRRRRSTARRS